MTASTDIATKLAAKGYGTVGSTIFTDYMPPSPDNCIIVSEYAGGVPERTHDTSGNDFPSVQVRVRNTSNATARSNIHAIYDTLDGIKNTTLTSTFYLSIFAVNSGAIPMGQDDNGRWQYVWNFQCHRRRP